MAEKKKKAPLPPAAAKILEQYRNAGKPKTNGEHGAPIEEDGAAGGGAQRPTAPPPAAVHRSGTRGK